VLLCYTKLYIPSTLGSVNLESNFWNYQFFQKINERLEKTILSAFEKRCSPKPFGQTKIGVVSGRLACTSSKTEILNKIGI
jgi:hypothetical protein